MTAKRSPRRWKAGWAVAVGKEAKRNVDGSIVAYPTKKMALMRLGSRVAYKRRYNRRVVRLWMEEVK